jgi:hypothetical protein
MNLPLRTAVAAAALFAAMPASAALVSVGAGCDITLPDQDAVACAGAFAGNLNNNSREADLNAALDILVGGDFEDVDFLAIEGTKDLITPTGQTITFDEALLGEVILSIHFGDAGSGIGDHTILYLFDFATPTLSVDLNQNGFSNGLIIGNPVPEPATWAMMLLGFGVVGFAMRRSRKPVFAQLA